MANQEIAERQLEQAFNAVLQAVWGADAAFVGCGFRTGQTVLENQLPAVLSWTQDATEEQPGYGPWHGGINCKVVSSATDDDAEAKHAARCKKVMQLLDPYQLEFLKFKMNKPKVGADTRAVKDFILYALGSTLAKPVYEGDLFLINEYTLPVVFQPIDPN